jgi:hypothetical protein
MMRVPIQTEPRFIRGRPEVLFTGSYFIGGLDRNYDISPDGQRFLMMKQAEQTSAPSQIIVVENWFEELKRLVPTP